MLLNFLSRIKKKKKGTNEKEQYRKAILDEKTSYGRTTNESSAAVKVRSGWKDKAEK